MTQHHRLHGHHDGPSQHAGPETQKLGLAGRIMWLPPKTVDLGFMDEIYNHPVVVLSPQQTRGKVDFLTVYDACQTLFQLPLSTNRDVTDDFLRRDGYPEQKPR